MNAPIKSNEGRLVRWLSFLVCCVSLSNYGLAQSDFGLTLSDYSLTNGATVTLEGTPGQTYVIQFTPPGALNWSDVGQLTLAETNRGQFIHAQAGSTNGGIYRARQLDGLLYSRNAVGFVNQQVPHGHSMVGNPFASSIHGSTVSILPSVPDSTCIWTPYGVSHVAQYTQAQGWSNPGLLTNGPGFWIYNPSAQSLTVNVRGEASSYWSPRPVAGLFFCTFLYDWGAVSGEMTVYKYNPATQRFTIHQYGPEFGWDIDPNLGFGDPFYLVAYGPGTVSFPAALVSVSELATFGGISSDPTKGQIFDDYGNPLAGCNFKAGIYMGPVGMPAEQLVLLGPPSCLQSNSLAGYLSPSVFGNVCSLYTGNVVFQVRAWEGAQFNSYEEALASGQVRTGKSGLWQMDAPCGSPPGPLFAPAFGNFMISWPTAAPTICQQPQSQIVSPGATVSLTVRACGLQPIYYQWQLNGTNIPGATSTNFTIPRVSCDALGNYSLVVSNAYGAGTSSLATLSLTELEMCAAITLCGPVGTQYRVEWANALATNTWQVLTNVTLPYSPYVVVDLDSSRTQKRFYRTIQVP